MPRPKSVPKLCRHKASGQAVVTIAGRDHYLGPHGSPEAQEKYDRLLAEWLSAGRPSLSATSISAGQSTPAISVNEVMLRFVEWATGYFRSSPSGEKEQANLKHALRPVKALYGSLPATEFGPKALKAVREHMVSQQGLCRNEVNKRIGRIKRMFKWAASEELLPSSVFHGLQSVEGLRLGRSDARESKPVEPVPDEAIDATLPFLSPTVATMVQLQRYSAARPTEICRLRASDIDRTGPVWIYRPAEHKTRHLGATKEILFGPRCQELLQPLLDRPADAFLFSPVEADEWRRQHRPERLRSERKTKVYPSELRARARKKAAAESRVNKRSLRDHYDADSYRKAIEYALKKGAKNGVSIPRWFPYQVRHTAGTEIRKQHGLEAAQVFLGHTHADVTQIYAERNQKLAIEVARTCG